MSKYAEVDPFNLRQDQQAGSTGIHSSSAAIAYKYFVDSPAPSGVRLARRSVVKSVPWRSAIIRQLATFTSFTLKHDVGTASRRSQHHFSATSTSTSSSLVSGSSFSHGADRGQLPRRYSSSSVATLYTNTVPLTEGFKNFAQIILSYGMPSSSSFAPV